MSDCGKIIGTLAGFTTHVLMHNEDKEKWVCETCNKRFPYESLLKRHIPIHSDAKDHKCPSRNCGKTFKSRQSLKAHLELHSGREFACLHPGCPKTFASAHYQKDHMNMQHGETYQCKWVLDGCDFTTRVHTTLHRHEDYFCLFKPDEDEDM